MQNNKVSIKGTGKKVIQAMVFFGTEHEKMLITSVREGG